jgi:hypothetical protein
MTTDERIARLRELDKNRTQGEWKSNAGMKGGFRVYTRSFPFGSGKQICGVCQCEETEANSRFIAAAPEMMQIINELLAKLKTAEDALEYYQYLEPEGFKAKQALAEIRKESANA